MADTKISAAAAVVTPTGAIEFPVNDGGSSKKLTLAQIQAFQGLQIAPNESIADQQVAASTTALLTGSQLDVGSGIIVPRMRLRWRGTVSKTAAGTAAKTMGVKFGTAGTTSDTTRLTFALPAGTAVVDTGSWMIDCLVRSVSGTSTIIHGQLWLGKNAAATAGLINVPTACVNNLSAAFDTTVASLKANVFLTTGVAEVWTFQQVIAEAFAW